MIAQQRLVFPCVVLITVMPWLVLWPRGRRTPAMAGRSSSAGSEAVTRGWDRASRGLTSREVHVAGQVIVDRGLHIPVVLRQRVQGKTIILHPGHFTE
jgi:hypothetical protein